MIFAYEFKARIHALSSYLDFSNKNWEKYEQAKNDEIEKNIDVLRQKFVDYQGLSNNEVSEKVGERMALKDELWNDHDVGKNLDIDFKLEPEENIVLMSFEERSEFLENKKYLYASFVMMCFSFIERNLIEICFNIPTEDDIRFNSNKLTGKGVYRAYKFLEKTLNYKIDGPTWIELMLIRRLRNNLVHQGFYVGIHQGDYIERLYENGVSPYNQDLVNYLTKWEICQFPTIELNFEYCQHLVDFVEKLFENLINDLRVKNRNIFL